MYGSTEGPADEPDDVGGGHRVLLCYATHVGSYLPVGRLCFAYHPKDSSGVVFQYASDLHNRVVDLPGGIPADDSYSLTVCPSGSYKAAERSSGQKPQDIHQGAQPAYLAADGI